MVYLVKPKKGTTMETVGMVFSGFRDFGLGMLEGYYQKARAALRPLAPTYGSEQAARCGPQIVHPRNHTLTKPQKSRV